MKGMKKLLSILMVLTLVLSLGASAFATTVTVNGPDGHTYTAYKVFTGTTANIDGKEVLASIEWANTTGASTVIDALKADDTLKTVFTEDADMSSAAKVAELMSTLTTDAQKQALARVLLAQKNNLGAGTPIESGSTNLDPGYYVIEDTTAVDGANDAKNEIVLEVVGNEVTVEKKHDVPESQKKVLETNDTAGTTTDWQDAADYDIGDEVPFQFVGTLPENLDSYTSYKMVFHDSQSAGLTFNKDSVKVYLGTKGADGKYIKSGDALTTGYTVNFPGANGTDTFDVTIPDVKSLTPIPTKDNVIIVEYTSKLNESAVIGEKGNPNTMKMEFSNNPGGSGTGMTPEDKVTVFTFKIVANKIDEEEEPLDGAGFTLLKEVNKVPAGQSPTSITKWEDLKAQSKDAYVTYNSKTYQVVAVNVTTGSKFEFNGEDAGTYLLVETTVPDGYNRADDITINVTAEYNTDSTDPKLTKLEVTPADCGFKAELTGENSGIIEGNVKNQSGVTLPETGGIGTTIFYVAGAILVAGAAILLVTKKRVNGAEK